MKTSTKTRFNKRWFIYFKDHLVEAYGFPSNYRGIGYKTLATAKAVATKAFYYYNIDNYIYNNLTYRQKVV